MVKHSQVLASEATRAPQSHLNRQRLKSFGQRAKGRVASRMRLLDTASGKTSKRMAVLTETKVGNKKPFQMFTHPTLGETFAYVTAEADPQWIRRGRFVGLGMSLPTRYSTTPPRASPILDFCQTGSLARNHLGPDRGRS